MSFPEIKHCPGTLTKGYGTTNHFCPIIQESRPDYTFCHSFLFTIFLNIKLVAKRCAEACRKCADEYRKMAA